MDNYLKKRTFHFPMSQSFFDSESEDKEISNEIVDGLVYPVTSN